MFAYFLFVSYTLFIIFTMNYYTDAVKRKEGEEVYKRL